MAQTCFSCSQEREIPLLEINSFPNRKLDFSLWQLNVSQEVQMGYIIRTDDNKVTVIDGGGINNADVLQDYILQLGGTVNNWIITHPHLDHMGAFVEIIKRKKIIINKLIHSSINEDLVKTYEEESYINLLEYSKTINKSSIVIVDANLSDTFLLGAGVTMEILGNKNADIIANLINNSSLVFKIESKSKSVLFLGDLGPQGANKILNNKAFKEKLKSQYVQMAHHGQNGVQKSFYEAVEPEYSLWPTPDWLWNNIIIEGKPVSSGYFSITNVKEWMEELNIKRNYVAGLEGNIQID